MSLPPLPELEPWAKCMVVREDVAQMRMREYGELCRKQALEQAAQVCAVVCSERWDKWGDGYNQGALDCETRIKELK